MKKKLVLSLNQLPYLAFLALVAIFATSAFHPQDSLTSGQQSLSSKAEEEQVLNLPVPTTASKLNRAEAVGIKGRELMAVLLVLAKDPNVSLETLTDPKYLNPHSPNARSQTFRLMFKNYMERRKKWECPTTIERGLRQLISPLYFKESIGFYHFRLGCKLKPEVPDRLEFAKDLEGFHTAVKACNAGLVGSYLLLRLPRASDPEAKDPNAATNETRDTRVYCYSASKRKDGDVATQIHAWNKRYPEFSKALYKTLIEDGSKNYAATCKGHIPFISGEEGKLNTSSDGYSNFLIQLWSRSLKYATKDDDYPCMRYLTRIFHQFAVYPPNHQYHQIDRFKFMKTQEDFLRAQKEGKPAKKKKCEEAEEGADEEVEKDSDEECEEKECEEDEDCEEEEEEIECDEEPCEESEE